MDAAPNKRSYIRLAAMRAMYLGMDRESVCKLYDRSDRMMRLWQLHWRPTPQAAWTSPEP